MLRRKNEFHIPGSESRKAKEGNRNKITKFSFKSSCEHLKDSQSNQEEIEPGRRIERSRNTNRNWTQNTRQTKTNNWKQKINEGINEDKTLLRIAALNFNALIVNVLKTLIIILNIYK